MPEVYNEEGNAILQQETRENKYKQVFSLRLVHYLALFIVLYTGLEITVGGTYCRYLLQRTDRSCRSTDRLDRHLRRSSPWRWRELGLHRRWVLRRSHARAAAPLTLQQEG